MASGHGWDVDDVQGLHPKAISIDQAVHHNPNGGLEALARVLGIKLHKIEQFMDAHEKWKATQNTSQPAQKRGGLTVDGPASKVMKREPDREPNRGADRGYQETLQRPTLSDLMRPDDETLPSKKSSEHTRISWRHGSPEWPASSQMVKKKKTTVDSQSSSEVPTELIPSP